MLVSGVLRFLRRQIVYISNSTNVSAGGNRKKNCVVAIQVCLVTFDQPLACGGEIDLSA